MLVHYAGARRVTRFRSAPMIYEPEKRSLQAGNSDRQSQITSVRPYRVLKSSVELIEHPHPIYQIEQLHSTIELLQFQVGHQSRSMTAMISCDL